MTDEISQLILHELAALRGEVRELRRMQASERHPFELLPDSAVVGKDYVAWRFGISERAVRCGEKGTKEIRRVSNRPLKFIKRDVDAAFDKTKNAARDAAYKLRQNAKPIQRRRKSIIKKAAAV